MRRQLGQLGLEGEVSWSRRPEGAVAGRVVEIGVPGTAGRATA